MSDFSMLPHPERELLLAQLKVESLRLRLLTAEVDTIGVALETNMITHHGAERRLVDLFGPAEGGPHDQEQR